jgi:hypothetical protein
MCDRGREQRIGCVLSKDTTSVNGVRAVSADLKQQANTVSFEFRSGVLVRMCKLNESRESPSTDNS